MRVLIDIAHPAHIHYFRNFARIFVQKGHTCLFTLRDKGIITELADHYKLKYEIRSKEYASKIKYSIIALRNIYKIAKRFKPDLFLDMGTVYASPIAKLMRKPYIAFDDTEASVKARLLHMPFTDVILTPDTFYKDLGKKHIKFHSLMEMMYLHPKYFVKRANQLNIHLSNKSNFVLIRFVSWEAHHDKGNSGIAIENKKALIKYLRNKYNVLISAESNLPHFFQKYKFNEPSHLMHDVLSQASFIITEGATMASEAAVLGTPTIYVNSIQNGYTIEQKERGILFSLDDDKSIIEKVKIVEDIVQNEIELLNYKKKHQKYINEKINTTDFLVWFIENYPQSTKIMKENPDYQYNFR